MAPLELYQKIYVDPGFLETNHGQIPCNNCHGGNPDDSNWLTAHDSMIKDPTTSKALAICGECHEEIAAKAVSSLHYTLAPFSRAIAARMGDVRKDARKLVDHAMDIHCNTCHASCGQCHVSRPDYVGGGFLAKHHFKRTPDMDTTCASCHGGRVYGEYTAANEDNEADVHFDDEEMTCMQCHKSPEMHACATDVTSRFELPERPRCLQCHEDVVAEKPKTQSHKIHGNKVACQVCHAQATKNCYSCHVGTDKKGLPYFKCRKTAFDLKIGLNPRKTKDRPYDWVVLRHPAADPKIFDHYVKNSLPDFNALPTWKLDTPHSIRRSTAQNKECNNCHGKKELFLTRDDVADGEVEANRSVIVPESKIPEPVTSKP